MDRIISENTLVPISFLVILLSAGSWFATVYQRVLATEARIEEVSEERRLDSVELSETRQGVARIEGKMDVLLLEIKRR